MKYDLEESTQHYDQSFDVWYEIVERQKYFTNYIATIILNFFPESTESVLELGAGLGQYSELFRDTGYDVLSSDVSGVFIDYMEKVKGLNVKKIDATNCTDYPKNKLFDCVFSQAISVLITKDEETIQRAYECVYQSLRKSGRFIFIFPRGKLDRYSRSTDHVRIYEKVGFKILAEFRSQAFPSKLYRYGFIVMIEKVIGHYIGIKDVLILEKV